LKKKVGLLISSLNGGGAERVVSRLSFILANDYDLYIILFDASNIKYDFSGKIININVPSNEKGILSKIKLLIKRSLRLKKIKKSEKLDMVISFLDSPNMVNVLSRTHKCKVILSVRNYIDIEKNTLKIPNIMDLLHKKIYRSADKIIPVSKEISKLLNQKYLISESKLKVVYNPYDINEIEELANEAIEDKYINFMSSCKIFISVGRQTYQKGFWHLVKAFKLVHEREPDSKLVIVGREENDGKLKNLIEELRIGNNVLLTGFHINPFKFIKNSQIYVMTSLFEGFPNSLVEAMACGCPVIATNCKSGPMEILLENFELSHEIQKVTYGDYGILVPPFTYVEDWNPNVIEAEENILAEAMIDLLQSKEKREYYSTKSFERAKVFNYAKCLYDFKSIIEDFDGN